MSRRSVSDILIAQKRITNEQYAAVEREAQEKKISWEESALQQGLISAADLAAAQAEQAGVPLVEQVTEKMAPPRLLSQVPLRFLREHTVLPIYTDDGRLMVLTTQPQQFQPIDELRMIFDEPLSIAVASRTTIQDAINKFYPLEGEQQMIADLAQEEAAAPELDFGEIGEEDILGMASEAPIIKLVNHILYQAVKRGASDIHIEPFEREIHVRYRIDGILHEGMTPPKRAQSAIISRIKIMAQMNIAEKRKPQGGRIQLKVANKTIDIRVSALPVVYGERIVMRLLDKSKTFGQLEQLGLSERDYTILTKSIEQPNGIILMTGPTGSGKTSTLYSILSRLNSSEVNVVTVEDPVEYQMSGIGQVQVREKIGLTFAAALREILRQDPDIIMIGETRDTETAQIAIQAALTGHLVLTTLHTNSAAASITRLIDMGIEPFLIASTLVAVIAQRLVRRLCNFCKQTYTPDAATLDLLGVTAKTKSSLVFYKPVGCDACEETGYKGRLAIFEIMSMSASIARLVIERSDTRIIQQEARKEGMSLLIEDGVAKIRQGLTSVQEVLSEATFREGIE